jgi:hypothetical protein
MNLVIPPVFFYAIGTIFIVVGALRAATLGRHRPDREIGEDTPERAKARRYHLRLGIIYVIVGVALIFMTSGVIRFRAPL